MTSTALRHDPDGSSADAVDPEAVNESGGLWSGAAVGVASGLVALGSAELLAGLSRDFSSPVTEVGNRVIDLAPPWLKTFAIENFGTNDKPILIGTVLAALVIVAALLGILARRRHLAAAVGVSLFGVLGAIAAWTGVKGTISAIPSLVGGGVGAGALLFLTRPAGPMMAASAPDSRRAFLRDLGAVTALGAVGAVGGRWLRTRFEVAHERAKLLLPSAKRPLAPLDTTIEAGVDGATPFITPNANFYRIDTALEVPQVSLAGWKLAITGMVDSEQSLTFDDLSGMDLVEAHITLTCVSNEVGGQLAGTARWLGVPLSTLLDRAGLDPDADQIVGRSVDGYTCGFPVDSVSDGRNALVAIGMNGEPLPVEHGFPARLIVAGLYGFVSATKWLTELEITRFDKFDQYWVPRGWSARGPIKTFSRIDTPRALVATPAGRVAVAGVAWAQTRGIDRVEVRVDDGPWQDAELKPVPNDETWRQWVLPMDLDPGSYSVSCRATDRTGQVQTEERVAPRPDGATGWHSVVVLVK